MFLLFFLFLAPFSLFSDHYHLAICTMFKNEAPWVREWLEYHRLLGFEHFYRYDNESNDGTLNVLQPYVERGIVKIIPWENIPERCDPRATDFSCYQLTAFNNCIQRTVGIVDWLAVIDIDEFIVPVKSKESFHALLKKLLQYPDEKKGKYIGSLKMSWIVYGTSGVWEIPTGKLMTESLYMRALKDYKTHYLTKCLHRPEAVADCCVHDAKLKKGYIEKKVPPGYIRINHYWARDEKSFFMKRFGLSFKVPEELQEKLAPEVFQEISSMLDELNQVRDTAIFPYLPALREALKQPH